jgi:hypothetical protein
MISHIQLMLLKNLADAPAMVALQLCLMAGSMIQMK